MRLNSRKTDLVFLLLLILISVIYLHNLGLMPLLADEPIRALVSLEMVLRNNYIFPTIAGEAYMNKPPLFNWMVSFVMNHTGSFTEWYLRIVPMVFFLLTAVLNFIVTRRFVNASVALFSSIGFLVCGRILFYDSMMGYIDPVFSFVILLNIFCIYILSKHYQYFYLFASSYLLCLIAFFLKGLPAFVFQACTLSAVFMLRGQWKRLFSLSHLFGICILMLGMGIYYYEYSFYNGLEALMETLWEQSAQRTPLSTKLTETFLHILSFPFQFLTDLAPFSFLIVFCFRKDFFRQLRNNEFVFYMAVIFLANIWVYWLSSETRARYLFMFVPLFFTIVFFSYEQYKTAFTEKSIWIVSLILCGAAALIACVPAMFTRFHFIEHLYIWVVLIFTTSALLFLLLLKGRLSAMMSIIAVLLVLRTGFNSLILPLRERESPQSNYKKHGLFIGMLTKGAPLYILKSTPLEDDILFYTTLSRRQLVLKHPKRPISNTFYICEAPMIRMYRFKVLYKFQEGYNNQFLYLVKK